MYEFKDLRKFFEDPPVLSLNIAENDTCNYRIEMRNNYLDLLGKAAKQDCLTATYTRKITKMVNHNLFFTEITTNEVIYETKEKNLHWTFAEGAIMPFYLFYGHYMDEYMFLNSQIKDSNGSLKQQFDANKNVFSKFPKLPSVSLFILQLHDVMGFENFTSQALSSPLLLHKPGEAIEMKTLSDTRCDLEGGSFAAGSFFRNDKIFARYHGLTLHRDKICSIFEFFCEGAKLDTKDKFRSKIGTSTYSVFMYIDHETGIFVKGYLNEYIYASQKIREGKAGMVPAPATRRVYAELIDDDDE